MGTSDAGGPTERNSGRSVSTREVVARLVRNYESQILSGALRPGSRLPTERELAQEHGLSRTTVREAIYELELKGLVERTRRRGTSVLDTTRQEYMSVALMSGLPTTSRGIAEILDFRAAIEPAIAARAARYATPADLLALEDLLARMGEPLSAEKLMELNSDFHEALARATHNRLFVELAELVTASMQDFQPTQQQMPPEQLSKLLVEDHSQFVERIRERDPEGAARVAEKHIEDVQREVFNVIMRGSNVGR